MKKFEFRTFKIATKRAKGFLKISDFKKQFTFVTSDMTHKSDSELIFSSHQ